MLMDAKNKRDVLLVGLVAFVGYAAAQGNLPTCVSDCGTVAAQAVGCASMQDLPCVCESQPFLSAVATCFNLTCDTTDANTGNQQIKAECAAFSSSSVTLSTSTTAAGTTTDTTTRTSTQASTTGSVTTTFTTTISSPPPVSTSTVTTVVPSTKTASTTTSSTSSSSTSTTSISISSSITTSLIGTTVTIPPGTSSPGVISSPSIVTTLTSTRPVAPETSTPSSAAMSMRMPRTDALLGSVCVAVFGVVWGAAMVL